MSVSLWGGISGLCWGSLLLTWSVGALVNVRQKSSGQKLTGQVWTLVIVLAYVALLMLLCTMLLPVMRSIRPLLAFDILWLRPPGLLVLVISTIFTLWARIILGTMWSAIPRIRPNHSLRTSGPYRITRHPIYTGLLGMIIGSLLMFASHQWFITVIEILFVAETLFILCLKIKREEYLLLATFGEEYVQYQKRVPQLLPFIRWEL